MSIQTTLKHEELKPKCILFLNYFNIAETEIPEKCLVLNWPNKDTGPCITKGCSRLPYKAGM